MSGYRSGRCCICCIPCGPKDKLTTHGFRSSFKDWAAEQTGHDKIVSEAALAHTIPNQVERAYQRANLLAKRSELMQQRADFCTDKGASAKIVSIHERAG